MVTTEQKQKIVSAIKRDASQYSSAAKQAVALDVNSAQLSRIKKDDTDKVIADSKWITIARKLGVQLGSNLEMVAAKTPVYVYIYTQLEMCQASSTSGMLCDIADIGKTFTAKHYALTHKNAVYVDCSQTKSKQKLIRTLAKEFGLNNQGRYIDVYADLVYFLRTLPNPLIILDEAGDLDYSAFLELKALWNATEYSCGWYMMGADGLKAKIEGNIGRKKVGYTEIFSRYGSRYQKITPDGNGADKEFAKKQTAIIAKANGIADVQSLYAKTQGSLRRIRIEIQKMKQAE